MIRRKHRGEYGRRVTAAYHRVMSDPLPLPPVEIDGVTLAGRIGSGHLAELVAPELAIAENATDLAQHPKPPPPDAPGYPVQRMDTLPGESD